jgi:hypothetical protein
MAGGQDRFIVRQATGRDTGGRTTRQVTLPKLSIACYTKLNEIKRKQRNGAGRTEFQLFESHLLYSSPHCVYFRCNHTRAQRRYCNRNPRRSAHPARRIRNGWNRPSGRSTREFGRSPSCTARASQCLRRSIANDIKSVDFCPTTGTEW